MLEISLDDLFLPPPAATAPEPGPVGDGKPRDAEWLRFDTDVRRALRAQKRAVMAAIAAGEAPPRITARSVQLASGRSRSQLYASHGHLLPLISAAQAAAERLVARRAERAKTAAAKPNLSALEAENRRWRADYKRLEADHASKQASEIFSLLFTRTGESMQAEIAQLKAADIRKDAEIQALRGIIAAMSTVVPFGPNPGSVIDVPPESMPPALT